MANFLDETGLTRFWDKLKAKFLAKSASLTEDELYVLIHDVDYVFNIVEYVPGSQKMLLLDPNTTNIPESLNVGDKILFKCNTMDTISPTCSYCHNTIINNQEVLTRDQYDFSYLTALVAMNYDGQSSVPSTNTLYDGQNSYIGVVAIFEILFPGYSSGGSNTVTLNVSDHILVRADTCHSRVNGSDGVYAVFVIEDYA